MGGIVDTAVRPPPAARTRLRFRPVQVFAALGCLAVMVFSIAAAWSGIIGLGPVPDAFRDAVLLTHFGLIFAALPLSVIQFALPKGTGLHRIIGYGWCTALVAASLVSFGVHEINGGLSVPHYFAILSLVLVPTIVWLARTHRTRTHSWLVLGFVIFFLVASGLFAFVPGRVLGTLLAAYWS